MNDIFLVKLNIHDDINIYHMLQRIGSNENEFKNTAHGLNYDEFKSWLIKQDDWSKGQNLPEGYVAQTIYWLYDGKVPVGIGKIRHELNDHSRLIGGNIGYAIDPDYRGRGYATILLRYLIIEARKLGIKEKLLSVEKYNPASRRVIEKNGGRMIGENENRWFFTFD